MKPRDYFPLREGLRLEFEGEAPPEAIHSAFEILAVKYRNLFVVATCRWDTGKEFEVVKRPDGVFRDRKLIFPLPINPAASWISEEGRCTVASLDFKTKVPAGEFTRCLRITYPIAGGDAGWGERVYAPGIGLIREVYSDEASPWMIALRRTSIPHDVFICHASEDKATVARKLAKALRNRGYRVWFDEFTLRVGDSLMEAINRGIASAAFGVVIFSPNFLRKNWPQRELNGLFAQEIATRNRILPVWHEVTSDDILRRWPILADKLSANSSLGTRRLADVLENAMRPDD